MVTVFGVSVPSRSPTAGYVPTAPSRTSILQTPVLNLSSSPAASAERVDYEESPVDLSHLELPGSDSHGEHQFLEGNLIFYLAISLQPSVSVH